jgi:hypothetical protein
MPVDAAGGIKSHAPHPPLPQGERGSKTPDSDGPAGPTVTHISSK